MKQATNVYIDIEPLTYEQVQFVNKVFTNLSRSKNEISLEDDYFTEESSIWVLDKGGDRGFFETLEEMLESPYTYACEPISYDNILEYASMLGLTKGNTGKQEVVDKPSHYQLFPEYQVRDINKAILDKVQESSFDMSLDEAGWFQQAMQYFMRFYAKNGVEDLEKGVYAMNIVIESLKERNNV